MAALAVLHNIERRIVEALRGAGRIDEADVAGRAGISADQARRGLEWLRHKGLVNTTQHQKSSTELGPHGATALKRGLPERRLLELVLSGTVNMGDLRTKMGDEFRPAMGAARSAGWVEPDGRLLRAHGGAKLPYEELLERLGRGEQPVVGDGEVLKVLAARGLASTKISIQRTVELTPAAESLGEIHEGLDVEADAPASFPARRHPLAETMAEIREVLVSMGFSEIRGSLVQPSFWNFDALYTPQDHPAREMQDTFFLEGTGQLCASGSQVRRVSEAHRRGWNYTWKREPARRAVLRTHTTCVTVRHLDESEGDARVFSMGRVFRNEKASRKHLSEFHQVEGVVRAPGLGLRDLIGMQSQLYKRLGLGEVVFWPTFFPYTEPSLQAMVRGPNGWVEMFGMGLLRPEVLGSEGRVLAWGGGVERIAMLKTGVEDVRMFYENDLEWLRCR